MDTGLPLFHKLEHLLQPGNSTPRILLLTGVPGSGKTRLARQLLSSQPIITTFQENVYWLTLGSSPDLHHLQLNLLQQVTQDQGQDRPSKHNLVNALSRRRTLLVLHNLCKPEHLTPFDVLSSSNGSRILITSSQPGVVLSDHDVHVEELPPLNDQQSLELIISRTDELPVEDTDELVQACCGNPLVLKVVSAAILTDFSQTWKSFQESRSLQPQVRLFKLLKLGYDALRDVELQRAFVYAAAFPENPPVSKHDLYKCWRAEGFAENETDWILDKLSLQELVETDRVNVTVHGLLREMVKYYLTESTSTSKSKSAPESESFLEAGRSLVKVDNRRLMRNNRLISLVNNKLSRIEETSVRCSPETAAVLLDGNPLVFIHESFISAFVNLRVLSLKGTSIRSLPQSVYKLCLLVTLDVSFSKIRTVSEALREMISLEYLDLSYCPRLVNFPVHALRKLTRLSLLNTEATPGVWSFSSSSSKVDWFNRKPETKTVTLRSISSLINLERLHVDANVKVALPEGIRGLLHLRVLHLYSTQGIKRLPLHLLGLTALEDVRISPLAQEFLPARFCEALVNLRVLWLGFLTELKELPLGLEKLKHLRELKLKRCSVRALPQTFEFENLEELELASFTSLSSLPAVNQLQSLKTLTLTGCMFRTVPESFSSSFSSLTELQLLNCVCLKEFPPLESLPRLRYLSLSQCCFTELPPALGLPNSFPALETFSLSTCLELVTFPEISDSAFPSLKSLHLKSCGFTHLPQSLTLLTSLHSLSLKNSTKLKTLPSLTALPKLTSLDLSYLQLEELPEMVASLEKLRELELEGCRLLETIPLAEKESSYLSLEHLNIVSTGIKLETLPAELTSRPGLQIYH